MVHRREVDGTEVVFGVQGALWGNAMTWWDHDTGSIWSQPLGEAIMGERKEATLELLPSTLTTWSAWRDAHPGTLALNAPNWNVGGITLDRTVIVVELNGEAAAYPIPDLQEAGLANDTVGGVAIAVVLDPAEPDRWAVLNRTLDDRVVTLDVRDGLLVDVETGTVWDPVRGVGREGPLQGEVLGIFPGVPSFPGDVASFWPDARFWGAP